MVAASKCTSLSAAAWTQGLLQLLSGNHLAHFATLLLFLPCSHHTFETSCPALCHTCSVGAVALALSATPRPHGCQALASARTARAPAGRTTTKHGVYSNRKLGQGRTATTLLLLPIVTIYKYHSAS